MMKFWRKWHKWLGLVLGIQVLLWISGGVVMSIIPLEMVRGNHLLERPQGVSETPPQISTLEFSRWQAWQWVQRLDQIFLQATDFEGNRHWLNPQTGEAVASLTPQQAGQIAQRQYRGEGKVVSVQLLDTLPGEVRGREGPLYRVDFDDWVHTSFYLHPYSASVLSVRSDLWRLFDFFWMLHILDFENRTDFNNPLLISLATAAWLFTLSGFILLYHSLVKPNWRKLRYKIR